MATIAIDFDGVIFEEEWPDIGRPIRGAIETINRFYNKGHVIIIWTCREGEKAEEAIVAMEREGLKYHYFNNNNPDRIDEFGYDSRKIGCDILIDDRCLFAKVIGIDWDDIDLALSSYLDDDED